MQVAVCPAYGCERLGDARTCHLQCGVEAYWIASSLMGRWTLPRKVQPPSGGRGEQPILAMTIQTNFILF